MWGERCARAKRATSWDSLREGEECVVRLTTGCGSGTRCMPSTRLPSLCTNWSRDCGEAHVCSEQWRQPAGHHKTRAPCCNIFPFRTILDVVSPGSDHVMRAHVTSASLPARDKAASITIRLSSARWLGHSIRSDGLFSRCFRRSFAFLSLVCTFFALTSFSRVFTLDSSALSLSPTTRETACLASVSVLPLRCCLPSRRPRIYLTSSWSAKRCLLPVQAVFDCTPAALAEPLSPPLPRAYIRSLV
ncbi:hypothetical protein CALCODRAFT_211337 [Calocera cornea HHB12733]|uniref:Uncharacterized protein n=1 Tax=Calocera cornea HHB12733 TaxID=1353952 RepID=A0A165C2X3_9BASI|nr:hypothetical protein CALCODRAFT_211337 [Calocera cornea HHB12733]